MKIVRHNLGPVYVPEKQEEFAFTCTVLMSSHASLLKFEVVAGHWTLVVVEDEEEHKHKRHFLILRTGSEHEALKFLSHSFNSPKTVYIGSDQDFHLFELWRH